MTSERKSPCGEDSDEEFFDWYYSFFYGSGDESEEETVSKKPKKKKVATQEQLLSVLHVKSLDWNIAENVKDHRTDKYDCTEDREVDGKQQAAELVIRRGQTFVIHVTFDREFVPDKDDLLLSFQTGVNSSLRSTTNGSFTVTETGRKRFDPCEWGGHLVCTDETTTTIEVHPPANCAIGQWSMFIETKTILKKGKTRSFRYKPKQKFCIIFNPWCKDDNVYMEDEYLLKEYILNEHGCVYKGNKKRPKPQVWNFGQFEEGILNISFKLLNDALRRTSKPKTNHSLSNPVWVVRSVGKMVNSQGDNGVLVGNWSGNYGGGTSPKEWAGSVKILREYAKTGRPVKYGQCWVFSAVTTTILRALGLPARSVTNYMSAHDTDKTCTIDKFYKRDDDNTLCELEEENDDSVWNFHVWNECWMLRPDIGINTEGLFDGWQAVDSTPQERSGGEYQCGPCSVYAIKQGLVSLPHDTAFVFAEVNADMVHWEMTPDGPVRFKLGMNKVGQSISTKKPDGKRCDTGFLGRRRGRLDITHCYKYKDGSEESRKSVMRASLGADNTSGAYQQQLEKQDLKFKLIHEGDLVIGSNLDVTLKVINESSYNRTVSSVTFRYLKQKYTGQTGGQVLKKDPQTQDVQVTARGTYEFKSSLNREEYISDMDEDGSISVQVFAYVKPAVGRSLQNCVKNHTVQLEEAPLEIQVPSKVKNGQKFEAILKVENPLDCELTDCYASFEGRGFKEISKMKVDNIPAKSSHECKLEMTPRRRGFFPITFNLHSKQLQQMSGSADIFVK